MSGVFSAPNLNTSPTTKAELASNWAKSQTAFNSLQNLIPTVSVQRHGGNLQIADGLVEGDGVIGTDSFVPHFGTDNDFSVTHETPAGKSQCVFQKRLHETNTAFTAQLTDLIALNGDYVVNFGIKTLGGPNMSMHLEVEDTDQEQDLTIWQFDVNKNGLLYTVTGLRRQAVVLANRDTVTKAFEAEHPLTWQWDGALPIGGGGAIGDTGIIIPWNAEIVKAYVRLGTPPAQHTDQSGLTVQLARFIGTNETSVLDGGATFTDRDEPGTVVEIPGLTEPPYQVPAGTYLYPWISAPELHLTDIPATAADLSITVLARRIYHEVYGY